MGSFVEDTGKKIGNLFRGHSKGPQYQPSNSTVRQEIPPYLEEAIKNELLPRSITESKVNRVTPFNEDQRRSMELVRGGIGRGASQLGKAEGYFNKAAKPLEEINYEAFMNPYLKNVLNHQLEGIRKDYELNKNDINSRAGMLGAYAGGGAQALHNMNSQNTQKLLNEAREKAYYNAFENAQKLALRDLENSERAGYNQIKLGDLGREYAAEDAERLAQIGQQQQGLSQMQNNEERNRLNFLLSMLAGVPMSQVQTQTNTPSFTSTKRSDRIGQLLGTALQAASLF